MTRIVIVGAGISGLTLAYRLQSLRPSSEVIVLEERSRVGGTIDTIQRDGFLVEAGPNGFPDNNPSTLNLARSLGMQDQLISASESAAKNRYLFLEGRLRLLPNSLTSFLHSDLLSWIAKLRLMLERFRPTRQDSRDESIYSFARRRVGDEVARTLVDPFVTGILAGESKLLSIEAAFPRLVQWERQYGSVSRGMAVNRRREQATTARAGKLWSFQGGLRSLVQTIASRLAHPPLLEKNVRSLIREANRWRIDVKGGESWLADSLVLTCPAYRQAELVNSIDDELAKLLAGIAYNRVVVVALGYRQSDVPHRLDGFGYLSPQRERRDLLGVQWCSSIYVQRAPSGKVLMRAICGGWHRGEMVDWPDDRLIGAVRSELARAIGVRVAPLFTHVVRWQRAIPQYHLGHLRRLEAIEQRLRQLSGLFLGGNAFRGVAINDCVEQAERLAGKIDESLQRK